MITIPPQLQNPTYRFVLIKHRDKRPFEVAWQKTNNYSYNDPKLLDHLAKGGNYGILGGFGDLILIDFDSEQVYEQVKESLPPTFQVKSGGGLPHLYYEAAEGKCEAFKIIDEEKNTLADIQGTGKQLVAPGSVHPNGNIYSIEKSMPVGKINYSELKAILSPWMKEKDKPVVKEIKRKDFLIDEIKRKVTVSELLSEFGVNTKKNPTECPFHSSKGGKCLSFDDFKGVWHCFHCSEAGDVFTLYSIQNSCEFKDSLRGLAKIAGLEKEYEESIKRNAPVKKSKKKESNEDDETIYTSFIEGKHSKIVEQVYDGLNSKYCIYDEATGEISYADSFEEDGLVYAPIIGEEIQKKAILLPSKPEEYGTNKELDDKIIAHIHKWLDIPAEMERFALWNIKRSWVFERFHTLNYLRALGDTGQGKTRFLDALGSIHYKPIPLSGATTAAPIFRIIEKWRGTIIVDEADFKSTDESQAIIKIINCGYEKGKHIMRCDQENAEFIHFFDPYCPKILATRKTFEDKAVESRCITQVMTGTSRRDIRRNLDDDFEKEALQIRNMLLLWRFRNFHSISSNGDVEFDLGDLEPRVEQIVTTFIRLFKDDKEQMEQFKQFIHKYQDQLVQERQDSWDGAIVVTIHTLIEKGIDEISAMDIIEESGLTGHKGNRLNPRALNSSLKSLGFGETVVRWSAEKKAKRCIPLEKEHLAILFKRYGLTVLTVLTGTMQTTFNEKKFEATPKNAQNECPDTPRNSVRTVIDVREIGESANRNDRKSVTSTENEDFDRKDSKTVIKAPNRNDRKSVTSTENEDFDRKDSKTVIKAPNRNDRKSVTEEVEEETIEEIVADQNGADALITPSMFIGLLKERENNEISITKAVALGFDDNFISCGCMRGDWFKVKPDMVKLL